MKFKSVGMDEKVANKISKITFFDSLAIYSLFSDSTKCFDMILIY